ncbi:hypothetical protein RCC89_18445 [Cytophagaceae bacterium ABcell3]|nr:hypothetical protein RCC89_18445 [Cytophagaceae bacterium ABcell3]
MKKVLVFAAFISLFFSCGKDDGCIHGFSDNEGNVLEMGIFITGSEEKARIINNTCKNEDMDGWRIVNGSNSASLPARELRAGNVEVIDLRFTIDDDKPLQVVHDGEVISRQF